MQNLIQQEQFELELLEKLNSRKFLSKLVFCGGTMLRLCYGLDRFSVDLDFWIGPGIKVTQLYSALKEYLSRWFTLSGAVNKFYTLLFEIKSKQFPRNLKIEIRKEIKKVETERAIAYSKYSTVQVFLTTVSLKEMMDSKIKAFLTRREVRDAFDMEFLLKKGIPLSADGATSAQLLAIIDSLTKRDYTVKLGSLLESEQRKYYRSENFKILRLALQEKIQLNR
jgi:predicted nucleotidyltransferase component of viral defense system